MEAAFNNVAQRLQNKLTLLELLNSKQNSELAQVKFSLSKHPEIFQALNLQEGDFKAYEEALQKLAEGKNKLSSQMSFESISCSKNNELSSYSVHQMLMSQLSSQLFGDQQSEEQLRQLLDINRELTTENMDSRGQPGLPGALRLNTSPREGTGSTEVSSDQASPSGTKRSLISDVFDIKEQQQQQQSSPSRSLKSKKGVDGDSLKLNLNKIEQQASMEVKKSKKAKSIEPVIEQKSEQKLHKKTQSPTLEHKNLSAETASPQTKKTSKEKISINIDGASNKARIDKRKSSSPKISKTSSPIQSPNRLTQKSKTESPNISISRKNSEDKTSRDRSNKSHSPNQTISLSNQSTPKSSRVVSLNNSPTKKQNDKKAIEVKNLLPKKIKKKEDVEEKVVRPQKVKATKSEGKIPHSEHRSKSVRSDKLESPHESPKKIIKKKKVLQISEKAKYTGNPDMPSPSFGGGNVITISQNETLGLEQEVRPHSHVVSAKAIKSELNADLNNQQAQSQNKDVNEYIYNSQHVALGNPIRDPTQMKRESFGNEFPVKNMDNLLAELMGDSFDKYREPVYAESSFSGLKSQEDVYPNAIGDSLSDHNYQNELILMGRSPTSPTNKSNTTRTEGSETRRENQRSKSENLKAPRNSGMARRSFVFESVAKDTGFGSKEQFVLNSEPNEFDTKRGEDEPRQKQREANDFYKQSENLENKDFDYLNSEKINHQNKLSDAINNQNFEILKHTDAKPIEESIQAVKKDNSDLLERVHLSVNELENDRQSLLEGIDREDIMDLLDEFDGRNSERVKVFYKSETEKQESCNSSNDIIPRNKKKRVIKSFKKYSSCNLKSKSSNVSTERSSPLHIREYTSESPYHKKKKFKGKKKPASQRSNDAEPQAKKKAESLKIGSPKKISGASKPKNRKAHAFQPPSPKAWSVENSSSSCLDINNINTISDQRNSRNTSLRDDIHNERPKVPSLALHKIHTKPSRQVSKSVDKSSEEKTTDKQNKKPAIPVLRMDKIQAQTHDANQSQKDPKITSEFSLGLLSYPEVQNIEEATKEQEKDEEKLDVLELSDIKNAESEKQSQSWYEEISLGFMKNPFSCFGSETHTQELSNLKKLFTSEIMQEIEKGIDMEIPADKNSIIENASLMLVSNRTDRSAASKSEVLKNWNTNQGNIDSKVVSFDSLTVKKNSMDEGKILTGRRLNKKNQDEIRSVNKSQQSSVKHTNRSNGIESTPRNSIPEIRNDELSDDKQDGNVLNSADKVNSENRLESTDIKPIESISEANGPKQISLSKNQYSMSSKHNHEKKTPKFIVKKEENKEKAIELDVFVSPSKLLEQPSRLSLPRIDEEKLFALELKEKVKEDRKSKDNLEDLVQKARRFMEQINNKDETKKIDKNTENKIEPQSQQKKDSSALAADLLLKLNAYKQQTPQNLYAQDNKLKFKSDIQKGDHSESDPFKSNLITSSASNLFTSRKISKPLLIDNHIQLILNSKEPTNLNAESSVYMREIKLLGNKQNHFEENLSQRKLPPQNPGSNRSKNGKNQMLNIDKEIQTLLIDLSNKFSQNHVVVEEPTFNVERNWAQSKSQERSLLKNSNPYTLENLLKRARAKYGDIAANNANSQIIIQKEYERPSEWNRSRTTGKLQHHDASSNRNKSVSPRFDQSNEFSKPVVSKPLNSYAVNSLSHENIQTPVKSAKNLKTQSVRSVTPVKNRNSRDQILSEKSVQLDHPHKKNSFSTPQRARKEDISLGNNSDLKTAKKKLNQKSSLERTMAFVRDFLDNSPITKDNSPNLGRLDKLATKHNKSELIPQFELRRRSKYHKDISFY